MSDDLSISQAAHLESLLDDDMEGGAAGSHPTAHTSHSDFRFEISERYIPPQPASDPRVLSK